MTACVYRAV